MGSKSVILVSGANGQLGKELKRLSENYPSFSFYFLSKEDMPIHHFEIVRHYFNIYKPAYFINAAAYTAVDRAESEKDRAFQINGEAVGVLAAICKENNCRFMHISTDYVFDGTAINKPYKEDDQPNPQSVYGASKLKGEEEALRYNSDAIIIRTSWVYSEFGKNFVKTMIKLMGEKELLNVVDDQKGSPTYAADLAEVILQIVASDKWLPGIYHYSNSGIINWYDFALAIKEEIKSTCKINPIPTSQYPTPAKRPAWSVLDNQKIQTSYGINPKEWRQSLQICLSRIQS
ncbi:MAG: dTDP-4-dehydrorhamnose reductase [Bacteroidetes bacterium]|nr:dTDP-4-dehydrorhamnose reductase [Bacteroidota bacterium]